MFISPILSSNEEYRYPKRQKIIQEIEKTSGRKVIDLGIGNPGYEIEDQICDFLKNIADDKKLLQKYPNQNSKQELQQAIQKFYSEFFDVQVVPNEILPVEGAKKGIWLILKAICSHSDKVVLAPNPCYPAYKTVCEAENLDIDYYDLDDDWISNVEKKVKAGNVGVVILNFPNNPTGKVTNLEELQKIVDIARANHVWVLYDNAYSLITYDNYQAPSILQVANAKDVCIEVSSMSKNNSLAGARIGLLAGNEMLISKINILESKVSSGIPPLLSKVGAYVLNNMDQKSIIGLKNFYQTKRNKLYDLLSALGLKLSHKPLGGLYIRAEIPYNYTSVDEFVNFALKEYGIFLVPGTVFEFTSRFVRASFSDVSDENLEEMERRVRTIGG